MRRLSTLLVPFTLLLASCGSNGPSAQEVVSRAPQATVDASTARLAMVLAFAADGTRLEIDGAVDFTHDRYAMTMHLRGAVDATAEARQDGTTLYLHLPTGGALLGMSPGDWMKLDLEAIGADAAADLGGALGLDSNDPRETLALLEGVSDDGVHRTGEEDVQGVHTTRYRADVDVAKALRRSSIGIDHAALQRFAGSIEAKTLTVTAWIDDDGLVRRLSVPLPTLTITTEYRDFGGAVDVAPPTGHVVDVSERLGELFPTGD
ncbi:MAG: hypothetical protein JWN67_2606 [Actinomycetia bacterium]|nr:hypothetical protein [Actinomycetes bacterium]